MDKVAQEQEPRVGDDVFYLDEGNVVHPAKVVWVFSAVTVNLAVFGTGLGEGPALEIKTSVVHGGGARQWQWENELRGW